jgi:prolyl 4-hydroxylase
LGRAQTEIIRCIEERASLFINIPKESIETLQVVRYDVGQQYKVHRDYISAEQLENDYWGQFGQRYASFFVYLQEPESGGNTTFYDMGISVPPRKNDGGGILQKSSVIIN